MSQLLHSVRIQDENEVRKVIDQVTGNYYIFIIGVLLATLLAFLYNYFTPPVYKISSAILIKENQQQQNMGDFLNNSLFGTNKNLENELLVLKSSPVILQTIKNLDLPVNYYQRKGLITRELYKNAPFKVLYRRNHVQPIGVRFFISFADNKIFKIKAEGEKVKFYNFETNEADFEKEKWNFSKEGEVGKLIETPEMCFIIELDSLKKDILKEDRAFSFQFTSLPILTEIIKSKIEISLVSINATAINISYKSNSLTKGLDIVDGIADVYSNQNLEKKNHLASITINYIDKQLGEISDSLSQAEQKLQSFRSSNQVLNVTEQSSGISAQYRELENQRAELISRKRYYEYVSDYLSKNEDLTNIIVPSSLGIPDQLLNSLMGELIAAQTQKSNLVENNQEKNPLVKRLTIQIDNLKKTITENISYVVKTTDISIDELNKRISKIEAQISRIPKTERQLTGIERKFRLNDAIYNYLMEKRAEANITRASNLPDNEIIEPAKMEGTRPVTPNKTLNYLVAFFLGLFIPLGYLQVKSIINNKIETQEQIEKITDLPVLGKILHNSKRNSNIVFESPNSSIAESYRALRTNLEYYAKGLHKKVILVTSSIEGEGKSFNALNLAISYAQLNKRTILLDFDLRKPTAYFSTNGHGTAGLSSYLINKSELDSIIINSEHEKFDYIATGSLPPNPVELIGLEKTESLINQLKELYDYIIIDTPPLAQVSDGYLLLGFADIKILVARYNYTIKSVFANIVKDLRQKNVENVCIVLNDNRVYRDQYGYGYGYSKTKK